MRLVERVAIILASLALSFGLIALLSGFFENHDNGNLTGTSSGPGRAFRDMGDSTLTPGELRPAYDSHPPTSGPHVLKAVTQDEAALSDDQLLSALAVGDVVILYGTRRPPSALTALARSVAGSFTPALAATGQAVILAPARRQMGLVGMAWAHMIRVPQATDPRLATFASYWLGRGAPRQGSDDVRAP
ncbi:MAG: DUF3105 domain-containing protein [Solirubrobacteraceae bacterium]